MAREILTDRTSHSCIYEMMNADIRIFKDIQITTTNALKRKHTETTQVVADACRLFTQQTSKQNCEIRELCVTVDAMAKSMTADRGNNTQAFSFRCAHNTTTASLFHHRWHYPKTLKECPKESRVKLSVSFTTGVLPDMT